MTRRFDHIDLRVPKLKDVAPFYRTLLPALGFTEYLPIEGWITFCNTGEGATEFFGITESSTHVPNENRISFWASSEEEVDAVAKLLPRIGAQVIEGPQEYPDSTYYVVFFEDPAGNRLELCHRTKN